MIYEYEYYLVVVFKCQEVKYQRIVYTGIVLNIFGPINSDSLD